MVKLEMYVASEGCIQCRYIREWVEKKGISDLVTVHLDKTHPLVREFPALVVDGASIIKGVIAIERYLNTHFVRQSTTE